MFLLSGCLFLFSRIFIDLPLFQTPGRVRAPTQSQDSGYAVVYICNLPPDFKDSELIELAKQFGPVWNSLILKHEVG